MNCQPNPRTRPHPLQRHRREKGHERGGKVVPRRAGAGLQHAGTCMGLERQVPRLMHHLSRNRGGVVSRASQIMSSSCRCRSSLAQTSTTSGNQVRATLRTDVVLGLSSIPSSPVSSSSWTGEAMTGAGAWGRGVNSNTVVLVGESWLGREREREREREPERNSCGSFHFDSLGSVSDTERMCFRVFCTAPGRGVELFFVFVLTLSSL